MAWKSHCSASKNSFSGCRPAAGRPFAWSKTERCRPRPHRRVLPIPLYRSCARPVDAWTGRSGPRSGARWVGYRQGVAVLLVLGGLVQLPPVRAVAATTASIQKELDSVAAAYGKLETQLANTEARESRLKAERAEAERVVQSKKAAFQARAGYLYKEGAAGSFFGQLLTAPDFGVFIKRLQYLSVLGDTDARVVEDLTVAQAKSAEIEAEVAATAARQRALARDLTSRRRQLESRYEEVKRAEDLRRRQAEERLKAARAAEELAKRRELQTGTRAAAPVSVLPAPELKRLEAVANGEPLKKVVNAGRYANFSLPIAGPVGFADTWGAPRSGGRSHQGTDVMAPCGAPVVAVTDGVISRLASGGSGGVMAYIRAANGDQFFYAHLQSYAGGAAQGKRVAAGDLIAYNGRSGNAAGGPCHVHFEWHPGGGTPVNPYPLLASAR